MFERCAPTLLVFRVFGGCSHPAAAPDARQAPVPIVQPADAAARDVECAQDRDCELASETCCDCNHGGRRVAVPVGTFSGRDCSHTMCPEMISNDPSCLGVARAYCRDGKCAITGIDDKPAEPLNRRFAPAPSPGDRRAPPRR